MSGGTGLLHVRTKSLRTLRRLPSGTLIRTEIYVSTSSLDSLPRLSTWTRLTFHLLSSKTHPFPLSAIRLLHVTLQVDKQRFTPESQDDRSIPH